MNANAVFTCIRTNTEVHMITVDLANVERVYLVSCSSAYIATMKPNSAAQITTNNASNVNIDLTPVSLASTHCEYDELSSDELSSHSKKKRLLNTHTQGP